MLSLRRALTVTALFVGLTLLPAATGAAEPGTGLLATCGVLGLLYSGRPRGPGSATAS